MPRYREDTLIDLCARPWAALTGEHRRAAVAFKRRTVGDAVTDAALRLIDGNGAASLTDACLRVLNDPKLAYPNQTQDQPKPTPASEETDKKENPTMTTTAKTTVKTKPQPEKQPAPQAEQPQQQPAPAPQQSQQQRSEAVPERRLDPEKDVRAALMHLVATTGTLVASGASTYPLNLAVRAQSTLVDLLHDLHATGDGMIPGLDDLDLYDDDDDDMEGLQ